jgi:hypothetical protein
LHFSQAMAVPRIALMVLNAIPCPFTNVEGCSVRVTENVDVVFHLGLTPTAVCKKNEPVECWPPFQNI